MQAIGYRNLVISGIISVLATLLVGGAVRGPSNAALPGSRSVRSCRTGIHLAPLRSLQASYTPKTNRYPPELFRRSNRIREGWRDDRSGFAFSVCSSDYSVSPTWGAIDIWAPVAATQSSTPSIQLFLAIAPVFLFVMSILGVVAAITLWVAHPLGRSGGLLYVVLWLASEAIIWLWAMDGPSVVRENTGGTATLVRFLVGGVIACYLQTVGERYVATDSSRPQP